MYSRIFQKIFQGVFSIKNLSRTGQLKYFSRMLIISDCDNIDLNGDLEKFDQGWKNFREHNKYFRENDKVDVFEKNTSLWNFFRKNTCVFENISPKLVIAKMFSRKNSYTRISRTFQRTFLCDVEKSKWLNLFSTMININ